MSGMNDERDMTSLVYRPFPSTSGGLSDSPRTGVGERESSRSIAAGLEQRLAELTEGAITYRSLARQYLRTAQKFVTAARNASGKSGRVGYEAHLGEARKAHDQARKCLGFARLLQKRAECLAIIGGRSTTKME